MKTLRVMGMRRSGNHAIINWLLANFNNGKEVIERYKTNCSIINDSTYVPIFINSNASIVFFNSCVEDPFWGIKSDFDLSNLNLIIHSYEDKLFSYIEEHSYNKCNNLEENIINIIILRDPYNMFASRQKYIDNYWTKVDLLHIDMWIAYAEEALNINNNINNKIIILYNKWLTDKDYRDDIANKLGVYNFDNTRIVSTCGNGSSFVGVKLDEVQNYLERYKSVKLSDEVDDMLNNDRVKSLVNQLFGS
jgi:hypothetical protein